MNIRRFRNWVKESFDRLSADQILLLIFQLAIVVATTCYVVIALLQWNVMKQMATTADTQAKAALEQLQEMKAGSADIKKQADNTEKLANAAIDQAEQLKTSVKTAITQSETTQEANRISRSGIERGQRPWVAIGGIRIFNKPIEGEPIKINAKIMNGGKTPAIHARSYHAFKLLMTVEEYLSTHIPLRNEPEIEKCTKPKPKWTTALGGAIVLPGTTNISFSVESPKLSKGMTDLIAQKEQSVHDIKAIDLGEIRREGVSPTSTVMLVGLYLVGCIDYFDESNIAHRTYFCFEYNPWGTEFEPTGDFNACINGNSAD